MYKVYILESLSVPGKSYVGRTTKSILERLKEHNLGQTKSTRPYLPWKLVYYEQHYCNLCSVKREVYLKSGKGFKFRKMVINHQSELL